MDRHIIFKIKIVHIDRLLLLTVVTAQIWDFYGLRKCLNLTALNKHSRVYDDGKTHVLCFCASFVFCKQDQNDCPGCVSLFSTFDKNIVVIMVVYCCTFMCLNKLFCVCVCVCFQPSLAVSHGRSVRPNCFMSLRKAKTHQQKQMMVNLHAGRYNTHPHTHTPNIRLLCH